MINLYSWLYIWSHGYKHNDEKWIEIQGARDGRLVQIREPSYCRGMESLDGYS